MARTDAPTERQLGLLYKLAGDRIAERYGTRGEERIETVGAIVEDRQPRRGDVSDWIDWFMRQPFDRAERPAPRPRDDFDPQTLEIGVYERPSDGQVYVVKPNRAGTRRYASKVVPVSSDRLTEEGDVVKVEFEYDKGAIWTLRPEMKMEAKRAEELSIRYGHCICCGHSIKVEASVARGIGPVCFKKYFAA